MFVSSQFRRPAKCLALALSTLFAALILTGCDLGADETDPTDSPAPAPGPAAPSGDDVALPAASEPASRPEAYSMAVFAEPITRNVWNYYGGPGGSVWTGYVVGTYNLSLYGLSDQRFDWVPVAAADFPTDLVIEESGGQDFWTTQVPLREGLQWSDGESLDASDFVFTVETVQALRLGSNWAQAVDPNFVERVEALDPSTVKVWFKATDDEGAPQTPGLGVWQFGLALMPIMAEHYWRPVVEESLALGDNAAQVEALLAHVPDGEPSAGGLQFHQWEPGAFYQNGAAPNFAFEGTRVTQFSDGSILSENPVLGYEETLLGEGAGAVDLEYVVGPHAENASFNIYGNQDTAILALTNGDVDYVFNPLGLEQGFRNRVEAADDLTLVSNANNGTRYLGFNVRKPPFDSLEFRRAVAILIDKEFVTQTVLQGTAFPQYGMVAEANTFWHNPEIERIGEGLSRAERIEQAVALLEGAGFEFEVRPEVSEDGNFVSVQGEGLTMPNGEPVPQVEILAPSAGYDPLRSTFAIWIERWLNDVGIPARANLAGFNVIVDKLFSENVAQGLDMWILGWAFNIFPNHLESFFHSRYAPENQKGGNNWGGFADPEFDDLADQFLQATTFADARDLAFQMQVLIATRLPYVTLFETPKLDAYRPAKVEFPYTQVLGGIERAQGMQTIALIK